MRSSRRAVCAGSITPLATSRPPDRRSARNVPTRCRKLLATNGTPSCSRAPGSNAWARFIEGIVVLRDELPRGNFARAEFLPAGGQGVIALQLRSGRRKNKAITSAWNHPETLLCLKAEREFLRLLQGDCNSPVGVLATVDGNAMKMRARFSNRRRKNHGRGRLEGPIEGGAERLAARLMKRSMADKKPKENATSWAPARATSPWSRFARKSASRGGSIVYDYSAIRKC